MIFNNLASLKLYYDGDVEPNIANHSRDTAFECSEYLLAIKFFSRYYLNQFCFLKSKRFLM